MKRYNNNFVDMDTLERTGSVLVSKSNAECFLMTCKMAEVKVKFELVNNKILFSKK